MNSVLGIDSAWTTDNPSGVALIQESNDGRWRHVRSTCSYQDFVNTYADIEANVQGLITAATRDLDGERPSLVAVDMPLQRTGEITGRRGADREISRNFGAQWCSTHSPTAARPGRVSSQLRNDLQACGYELAVEQGRTSAVIEVYPHPALLVLLNLEKRLPYKVERRASYWCNTSSDKRRNLLIGNLSFLYQGLAKVIDDIPDDLANSLNNATTFRCLKSAEDQLDALVCAWVGTRYLEGCVRGYGDAESVIWVPKLKPRGDSTFLR